jgi:two-component system sensor histidine kinase BaeS
VILDLMLPGFDGIEARRRIQAERPVPVLMLTARTSETDARAPALVLRGQLALLEVLTVVVLASAVHRLGLYEDAFGFTRLRLFAHAFMLWLAGVLALVLLGLASARGGWLPRAVTVGTAAALMAFSLANPDAIVAERNLERAGTTGQLDAAYLAGLSADATPVLAGSSMAVELGVLRRQAARLAEPDAWASWNVGRERARDALRRQGALR